MIAVTKIGGHQAIVQVGEILEVDKIDAKVGASVHFETLLVSDTDGGHFQIGTPLLAGVTVEAKIIEHARTGKIRVFKMKPRKRYRRDHGHRQDYTVIEIIKIGEHATAAPKKVLEKKKAAKPIEKKPVKKAPAKKTVAKVAVKKPIAKKTKKA